jgi:hypothetical protein
VFLGFLPEETLATGVGACDLHPRALLRDVPHEGLISHLRLLGALGTPTQFGGVQQREEHLAEGSVGARVLLAEGALAVALGGPLADALGAEQLAAAVALQRLVDQPEADVAGEALGALTCFIHCGVD